jgi:hypothetical protein
MYGGGRHFAAAAVIGLCIIPATAARAEDEHRDDEANRYVITNLVSDLPGAAAVQDNVLPNSWGAAFFPGGPFWIADNATGCATPYDGDGTIAPLQVSIPFPGNMVLPTDCKTVNPKNPPKPTPAAPTGIIWNPPSTFVVAGTGSTANPNSIPAVFIFDSDDRTISAGPNGETDGRFGTITPAGETADNEQHSPTGWQPRSCPPLG